MTINDLFFFFSSRRRHTRWPRDWSSDVCSSDLDEEAEADALETRHDVRAELREEPQVLELDEDRRQARELRRVQVYGPHLPRREDRDGHRDLRSDLGGPITAHGISTRCDGCQRNARRSIVVK